MSDKGIIFSAPMVRALLDGRKTQTRRLLKNSLPPADADQVHTWFAPPEVPAKGVPNHWAQSGLWAKKGGQSGYNRCCGPLPYRPGDRLYVREAWRADGQLDAIAPRDMSHGEPILYEADGVLRQTGCAMIEAGKLRPGMFLPRWASRLTLLVTDVRVQRVAEISEEDAIAEGVEPTYSRGERAWKSYETYRDGTPHPHASVPNRFARRSFEDLWNSLHTKPGERWEDNPWIVAVSFDVHPGNIDRSDHA